MYILTLTQLPRLRCFSSMQKVRMLRIAVCCRGNKEQEKTDAFYYPYHSIIEYLIDVVRLYLRTYSIIKMVCWNQMFNNKLKP